MSWWKVHRIKMRSEQKVENAPNLDEIEGYTVNTKYAFQLSVIIRKAEEFYILMTQQRQHTVGTRFQFLVRAGTPVIKII
jgi:hypothetical protein